MSHQVRLPKLGAGVEQATIVAWLKRTGDPVVRGEPLVQVETDKAIVEIEAPADGVLESIEYARGSVVPIQAVIAVLK